MYPGDFTVQCRYAFRKLKKVLARNGAGMSECSQASYVRGRGMPSETGRRMPPGSLRQGAAAGTHIPQCQAAWPEMLVEIDVIAMAPLR